MGSAEEGFEDIFEDYESRENDGEVNGTENNEESNKGTGVKVQPTKRIVKNPRLKFNPERLCGERGIPVLVDHFKNVKFKGKGHEEEDLDKLLSKLEHWTHRLFPSMKFEDCLHHIEKLGKKRPVQTCLRKIRLNMPILSSDFVKDDEEDDVQRNEDSEPVEVDAFDRLIGESQNFNPITTTESMVDSNSLSMNLSPAVHIDFPPESIGQVLGSFGSSLTEEQKERLEHNRKLAIERRKVRLAASVINDGRPASKDPNRQSFDSLFRNEENKSHDSLTDNRHNDNDIKNSSELNNSNLDNLGLDDLIDLVDEEECTSDKN